MKKLDWYILKKILGVFVFVVIGLVVIICVIDFTEKNDDFLQNQVSSLQITKYYLALFPYYATLLTPITAFIATVFVTSKLATQTEIIAILASGVSFRRLLIPFFISTIAIGVVSFIFMGYLIPDANKYRIDFEMEYLGKSGVRPEKNMHFKIAKDAYLYLDHFVESRNVAYNIVLERIEEEQLKEKLTASRMIWDVDTKKWGLYHWQRRVIMEDEEIISEGGAVKMDTLLNITPSDLLSHERLFETLTMTELDKHIELQKSRGEADVQLFQIEKYIRYMQPFGVIILGFIGVIVSARKSRRGTGIPIALGFALSFVYIMFFTLSKAIAESGTMTPLLAVWIPNLIFTGIGLMLYRTVPR